MPKIAQYSPDQEEHALKLLGEGRTISEIADETRLTVGQVNGIKRKHGLSKPRGPRAEKASGAYEAGESGELEREIRIAASRIQREKQGALKNAGASGVMRALQEIAVLEERLHDARAVVEAIEGLIEEKQGALRELGVSIGG